MTSVPLNPEIIPEAARIVAMSSCTQTAGTA